MVACTAVVNLREMIKFLSQPLQRVFPPVFWVPEKVLPLPPAPQRLTRGKAQESYCSDCFVLWQGMRSRGPWHSGQVHLGEQLNGEEA